MVTNVIKMAKSISQAQASLIDEFVAAVFVDDGIYNVAARACELLLGYISTFRKSYGWSEQYVSTRIISGYGPESSSTKLG